MSRTFLPWLREGLAGEVTTVDGDAAATNRTRLAMSVQLDDSNVTPPGVELLGPGDVLGFDQRQILRVDPPDGTGAHEPARYPLIEFASVSLPWLVTPTTADGQNRLRPWLTLVVLDDGDDTVTFTPGTNGGPGTVHLKGALGGRLPDPADVWAGAHVQVAGAVTSDTLAAVLENTPERTLSRLIWPYPLAAGTDYLAAVVPTFEAGRLAGLGQPASGSATLTSAWTLQGIDVTLPVYYLWRFSTGDAGDFASLAALLQALAADRAITELDLDVSAVTSGTTLAGTGPLTAGMWDALPADVSAAMAAALKPVTAPGAGTAELGLASYGAQWAGRAAPDDGDSGWFAELNLDPRLRVAAGAGAELVRRNQDALVAAAWQQLDDALAANAVLGRAQLARSAASTMHDQHLQAMGAGQRLALAAPASSRTRVSDLTIEAEVDASEVPNAVLSPALRRFTRPRGPIARHAAASGQQVDASSADSTDAAARLGASVLTVLNPAITVPSRMATRVQAPVADTSDPLAQVTAAPTVPAPLYPMLAAAMPQLILPGADRLPPNAITLLAAEPRFVAAVLVGFNTELARELAWRGYPLDHRATMATHFWDYQGQAAATADIAPIAEWNPSAGLADVVSSSADLTMLVVRGDLLRRYPRTAVYAVRAVDAHTLADESVASNLCQPEFTGSFDPDVRFFGFAMSADVARDDGGTGWFFVLQEQVTESRFGNDDAAAQALTGTAADVAVAAVRPPVRVALHARDILVGVS